MFLISANPTNPLHFTGRKAKPATGRKAPKKGASAMAKKHRTAAQKAATKRLVALNRSRKTSHNPSRTRKVSAKRKHRTSHNPTGHRRTARRRTSHNPSLLVGGGLFGKLLSMDGAMMIGAAFLAPMATDYLQEKIMPSATGWTKVAIKAGLVLAGAWAIDKFLKKRDAALAYGVTGAAVVASDAVQITRGVMQGLSASEADMLANRPDLISAVANGTLGSPYAAGLGMPYASGLGNVQQGSRVFEQYAPIMRMNPNSGVPSAFQPAFSQQF